MLYLQDVCFGSKDNEEFWKEFHEEVLNRKWYQVQEIYQAETSERLGHCSEHLSYMLALFLLFLRHLLPATAKDRMLN